MVGNNNQLTIYLLIIISFILIIPSNPVLPGGPCNFGSSHQIPSYLPPQQSPQQSPHSSNRSRVDLVSFSNVTDYVGLAGVSGNFFSWGDYNNDGHQDLLVNGGRLFENNGPPDYDFIEVTQQVGISGGGNGAWADYDNDGCLDIYCTGSDILWHNEGSPSYKFKDVTLEAGSIRDNYPTTAVGWGDYDLDGYLDLYIANGEDWNDGNPIYYPDFLYHNNGNGTFTDVTNTSGIRTFGGPFYGRGVAWGDFDNNGWPDIYVSNYRISQNWLFYNNKNGTFTDIAMEKGVTGEESQRMGNTYYGHTVGSAWADLDNDGDLDLFESNLVHKDLYRGPICGDSQIYRNNGPGNDYSFTDVRSASGVPEKNIGGGEDELFVGIAMGDFDNDGFQDFFIPQIYDLDYSYSYLYHNNGDWSFSNVSNDVGVLVWNTYGGAWCDYNNDGFLDLVTGGKGSADPNTTYEIHLYQNSGNKNSWLHVKLKGRHYNKQGIGVRVKVIADQFSQIRELEGGSGGHSQQNSIPVEFGFGSYSETVAVEVSWPSGYVQVVEDVNLNQLVEIEEPKLAPDLSFINVKVLDEHPVQGDTVTIEASVVNKGYLDADSARVVFYDGLPIEKKQIGEVNLGGLEKFTSIRLNISWDTSGLLGEHELWVVLDDVEPSELVITNNAMNTSIKIREKNFEPEAVLSAVPVSGLLPGDTVSFDGSNSSDDIKVEYYNFVFGDGNSTSWIKNSEIDYQYSLPGKFTASLIVKDSEGAISTNTAQVKITIDKPPVSNRKPVIDSFTADPTELGPGDTTSLRVIAHDPDDDELEFLFTASAGELSTSNDTPVATWRAPNTEGNYEINVKVSDGEYFSDTITLEINVIVEKINHEPIIIKILVSESQIKPRNTTTITVQAYDSDLDDTLTYEFAVPAGQILGTGFEVVWQAPDSPGGYIITVRVTDKYGLYTEEELTIFVIEEYYQPSIVDAYAKPAVIANDGETPVLFVVKFKDTTDFDNIYRVTIDLSSLGGDSNQKMYDNGKSGDEIRDDGVYSYEYLVPGGFASGTKIIDITVKDYSANIITHKLELQILDKQKDSRPSGVIPGFESAIFIFSLVLLGLFQFVGNRFLNNKRK